MPTANCIGTRVRDRTGQISFEYEWACEDDDRFEEVAQFDGDIHRWDTEVMVVIREKATGALWGAVWRRGNTEMQESYWEDRGAHGWDDNGLIWFRPVEEKTRTITEYVFA